MRAELIVCVYVYVCRCVICMFCLLGSPRDQKKIVQKDMYVCMVHVLSFGKPRNFGRSTRVCLSVCECLCVWFVRSVFCRTPTLMVGMCVCGVHVSCLVVVSY